MVLPGLLVHASQAVGIERDSEVCVSLVRTKGRNGWSDDEDLAEDDDETTGPLGLSRACLRVCAAGRIRLDMAYAPRYDPGACHHEFFFPASAPLNVEDKVAAQLGPTCLDAAHHVQHTPARQWAGAQCSCRRLQMAGYCRPEARARASHRDLPASWRRPTASNAGPTSGCQQSHRGANPRMRCTCCAALCSWRPYPIVTSS